VVAKPFLSETTDAERVRQAVKQHRQRISLAKAELEGSLGKEFSPPNFGALLKKLNRLCKRLRRRVKRLHRRVLL